jgi:TonB family protein
MTETEIWTKWESQVVNGVFPLRRFLGRSNHSVVFLTECNAQNLANAAIKIMRADSARAEAQLSRWQMIAGLSHPHLMRLLEAGSCKLGGHPFLFVVTEYAEQNLAQILPRRALSVEETTEMLIPTLDALAFLHRQNLVHGQLKPANFLVVNDQLKLSSDSIRLASDLAIDRAGDMRALGATIVEALTQTRPALNTPADALSLPASLSSGFAGVVRRCLSPEPGNRPTVSELRAQIDPPPKAAPPQVAAPHSSVAEVSARTAPAPSLLTTPAPVPKPPRPSVSARRPQAPWLVPAAAVGMVLLALWAGGRVLRGQGHADLRPIAAPVSSQQTPAPEAAQSSVAATPSAASPVVHEEIPAMSRAARESIHGQIKVVVRVTVDRAGNVAAQNLEIRGSSGYFARLATEAARKWKFAPVEGQSAREWLLQFEFSRSGVTGHAVARVRQ